MLVLGRFEGEKLWIGPGVIPPEGITIEYLGLKGRAAKFGITAPNEITILREELLDRSRGNGGAA